MYEETTEKLLEFISKSPTAFQAAEETRRRFLEEGFTELKEEERWELEKGGKYFVMRNHSAIIGFSIPVNDCRRYHIIASHSDSPSFKIKRKSGDVCKRSLCETECGAVRRNDPFYLV